MRVWFVYVVCMYVCVLCVPWCVCEREKERGKARARVCTCAYIPRLCLLEKATCSKIEVEESTRECTSGKERGKKESSCEGRQSEGMRCGQGEKTCTHITDTRATARLIDFRANCQIKITSKLKQFVCFFL